MSPIRSTLEGRQLSIRQFTREGWHRIERFEESISERTTQNSGGGTIGYDRWGYGGGAGIGLGTVLVIVLVCFMLGLFR